ncbi:MAG: TlpA disulfide reductase family protein [Calditrichota bacterium]
MNFKFLLALALSLSLIAGSSVIVQAQEEVAPQAPNLVKAADFQLTDLDGKPVKLSDYRGKVIILDFWATWCPPCVKEIPHFNELAKKYQKKGLVVLGVSVDRDGAKAVEKFKSKNALKYRVAMSNDTTYQTYQSYLPEDERGGIPFTFVIDKEGFIRQYYVGYRDKEVFVEAIKPLL